MFCDKTGTLTQNDLDVKLISVNGEVFKGETREQMAKTMSASSCGHNTNLDAFTLCLCLCNDIRVSRNERTGRIELDGESQDELLLLKLVQAGDRYEIVKRDQFSITLLQKASGQELVFKIVRVIAFSTDRKMMSVVVRNPLDNDRLYVFTKGADEVIFKALDAQSIQQSATRL